MTEPKPVVLPLHHDPIAMQKYELFLKLARVSPKKTQKKCIFGCFGAFSSKKKRGIDAFSRFVELLSSDCQEGIYQQLCNDCRRVRLHPDDVSKTFLESVYASRRLLASEAPRQKVCTSISTYIYNEKDWENIGYLIFFL